MTVGSFAVDPVFSFFRHEPPNAATGIGNISFVPWYHMNVGLINGLTSCMSIVDVDVETVRAQRSRQIIANLVDQQPNV